MKRNETDFDALVYAAMAPLPEEGLYLAAVSGGADSTAMLLSLASLREAGKIRLSCLHVEHGIRPAAESRGDERAVVRLCEKLGLPCRVVRIGPGKIDAYGRSRGIGVEAAARLYRHAAFKSEAARIGAERILLAHTRDDLLETLLMRILRGSGPSGLAAMPRSRGKLYRPLLDLSRRDVLNYLESRQMPYCTDATNADNRFLRNRVRNLLIPLLDAQFPGWRKGLMALAETQRLAADFIAGEAERRLVAPFTEALSPGEARPQELRPQELRPQFLGIPADRFFAEPEIIREEALFAWINRFQRGGAGRESAFPETLSPDTGGRKIKNPRRETLRSAASGERAAVDLGPLCFEYDEKVVRLSRPSSGAEPGFARVIDGPGDYRIGGLGLKIERDDPPPDSPRGLPVLLPLVLRSFFPEDINEAPGELRERLKAMVNAAGGTGYPVMVAEDGQGIAAIIPLDGLPTGLAQGGIKILVYNRKRLKLEQEGNIFFLSVYSGRYDAERSE